MTRLSPSSLAGAARNVRLPAYDRAATRIGLAHIGVGAFHRCHQAEYSEDALEAHADDRAEIGINIRLPLIEAQLGAQEGLYTRMLVEGESAELRVIGAIRRVIDATDGSRSAVDALADPAIDVISMTVTEKGYCHVPATGELDLSAAHIADDLARESGRRTLPGLLAEVLGARMIARAPVTLVSCDNIPANGHMLRNVVTGFANVQGGELGRWIAEKVRFPSTMVDRIVPAAREDDRARVEQLAGWRDEGVVVGEPFRQWVIEDDFITPRPRWDIGGAEFVADVEPYEFIKMRVLNACQSALSYLGALAGHETSFDAARDPLLADFARRMILDETATVLPHVPGMEVAPYLALSFKRLNNSAIRHRCHQIATDGSQKINQRILQPLRDRLATGRVSPLLETAVGSWIAYLAKSQASFGALWQAEDPLMPLVADAARQSGGNIRVFSERFTANQAVFGDRLAEDVAFRARVAARTGQIVEEGVHRTLGQALSTSVG